MNNNLSRTPQTRTRAAVRAGARRRWPLGAVLLALTLALSGCTMVRYSGVNGETFTRTSFGAQTSLAALEVESGTNGVQRFKLQGYQNETAQALGTITEAAVRAALTNAPR